VEQLVEWRLAGETEVLGENLPQRHFNDHPSSWKSSLRSFDFLRNIGERMYNSHFLELGTSWRWVVSFTPRPLYPRRKSPRHPLDRRFGGPQSRSGRLGKWKCLTLPGLELRTLCRPARSQSLYRLRYHGSLWHFINEYFIIIKLRPLVQIDINFVYFLVSCAQTHRKKLTKLSITNFYCHLRSASKRACLVNFIKDK
jgi:hypothetical protein